MLKQGIPRGDAVYNVGRVAWLVNALASGNLDNLRRDRPSEQVVIVQIRCLSR